ncbi:MAG TPA: ATP-binding protein [Candidatus Limnocylindrales bacterium]|nr:ATP-binding protein [Candidatus Limnocylindrales bacterium]
METILAKALGHDASQYSAEEKRDLLERLLARLAHEIRNPLSSLDVHVQLLEEDLTCLSPDMRNQLNPRLGIIRGELHRLESIVSQFLRLASPSSLDLEPVEIAKIVNHVCDLLRPEAATRQIEISVRIQDPLPEIQADSVRLTQALLNLVINAIQAVERNGQVEVTAQLLEQSLSLSVLDNGPGLPTEKLASIFDPFFTTKSEGHGLGLWIAQQIVTAHGGRLTAQNRPERGAAFMLILPLTRKEPVGKG